MKLTRIEVQSILFDLASKKGYVTEKEISKLCDDNSIDLFEVDKIMQFLLDRKIIIQDLDSQTVNNKQKDSSDIYDRSQADYDLLYDEITNKYPELNYLVSYIKNTLPPQRNEWYNLILPAKQDNTSAKKRLVTMYLRTVLRLASNFSESYGSDFEDSFQNGVLGLMKAIESYDITSPQPFSSYFSFHVLASMQRNYEKKSTLYVLPLHHYQDLFNFLSKHKNLIEKYGLDNAMNLISTNSLDKLKKDNIDVYNYLQPSVDINFNYLIYNDEIEKRLVDSNLQKVIDSLLGNISTREKEILEMRHGLNCLEEKTLEEIGNYYSISRERVRQIESRSLKKLRRPNLLAMLADFTDELCYTKNPDEMLFHNCIFSRNYMKYEPEIDDNEFNFDKNLDSSRR